MAAYKWTMVFQYLSGTGSGGDLNLKGGWTESVYSLTNAPATLAAFRRLCEARAGMLPLRSFISGIRTQQVDPSGAAQTRSVNYAGGSGALVLQSDIPQMALLLRVGGSGVANVRSMRTSAVPDSQIVNGEFKPTAGFRVALNAYLARLAGWRFRGTDLTTPEILLKTVTAAGVYTTESDLVAPVGTVLKVLRTKDANGNLVSGRFKVGVATSLRQGTLRSWTAGDCSLGTVKLLTTIYPEIITTLDSVSRTVVRKIGRPSLGYRGRRSKRRA